MAKQLKCNSCGGIYPDTRDGKAPTYIHVCPDELIDAHAVCDEKGNVVTPATFRPVQNPRNENLKRHPDNPTKYVMVSEGAGVTEVS